ncbi:MAG TPA: sigma-70 family RNA polymerase sigma factor [Chthonomonadaceae bacterium]|nr:sigma-70 family RNA polymerase sigma factor [Chthonomonadaceae bacterium]
MMPFLSTRRDVVCRQAHGARLQSALLIERAYALCQTSDSLHQTAWQTCQAAAESCKLVQRRRQERQQAQTRIPQSRLQEPVRGITHRAPAPDSPQLLHLIDCCKAGDPAAWNRLIHSYENLIFAYAYSLAGNTADAGDIATLVFVRLYQNLHRFENGRSPFRFWLLKIVYHAYIDVCVRDRQRSHLSQDAPRSPQKPEGESWEIADRSANPESLCVQKETARRLQESIRYLPAYQRQALQMFMQGRSYEEIARETGLSMGTVKSRINRARRTLSARLEEN